MDVPYSKGTRFYMIFNESLLPVFQEIFIEKIAQCQVSFCRKIR
jgi:hypothetical protein